MKDQDEIDDIVDEILDLAFTAGELAGEAHDAVAADVVTSQKHFAKAQLNQYVSTRVVEARKDELHNLGESMLTPKGLMFVIARNQELNEALEATAQKGKHEES